MLNQEYPNYYQTLGVAKDANAEEIKKQYRRLARKYHPDVSKEPNAEEMFKKVQEAYEVLKDPEKRRAYDNMGQQQAHGFGFQQHGSQQHGFQQSHINPEEFSDFFQSIFGQNFQQGTHHIKRKGRDVHSVIKISLEEAYHGSEKTLLLNKNTTKELKVKIPAGITEGQQIRLSGMGEPGIQGGPPGDLYLEIQFTAHPYFSAQGRDIYLKLPITPWEAGLGADIEIPSLGGTLKLKIAPGAESGQKMRLKGRGLPAQTNQANQAAGDLYAILSIAAPAANNDEQRELYERMKTLMPFNPRAKLFK